jgi:hypothetical protein
MSNNTIDKDSALAEFDGMCDTLGLDTAVSGEEAEDFNKSKDRIVRAIMQGALTIGDDGLPTYTTTNGDALTIKEPTGATLLEMDTVKAGQDMRKTYKIIGAMTGGKFVPSKCKMRDVNLLTAIMAVFMAG